MRNGTLASSSYDKTVREWDLSTGKSVIHGGHTGVVTSLAELPDGVLVSGSVDGTIRLWKGAACQVIDTHPVLSLLALSSGALAIGSHNSIQFMFSDHDEIRMPCGASVMAELPNGKLAIGSLLGVISVWNISTGVRDVDLSINGYAVRALAVLPDGNLVAGYSDGYIRIWNNGTCLQTIAADHGVSALVGLTNGRFASGEYALHVWG
jgi:hypothetical protein